MHDVRHLRIALLLLRIGVAMVLIPWSLDKILHPEHAGRVFELFYRMPGASRAALAVFGVAELALAVAFTLGIAKRFTYGTVLVMHGISTLSSYRQYLDPFANVLFFAAWPMLAACVVLYLLREDDTLATLASRKSATGALSGARIDTAWRQR